MICENAITAPSGMVLKCRRPLGHAGWHQEDDNGPEWVDPIQKGSGVGQGDAERGKEVLRSSEVSEVAADLGGHVLPSPGGPPSQPAGGAGGRPTPRHPFAFTSDAQMALLKALGLEGRRITKISMEFGVNRTATMVVHEHVPYESVPDLVKVFEMIKWEQHD